MNDAPVVFTTDRRGVATLTLNRPDKRNALGDEMLATMAKGLTSFAQDSAVRCVLIRAAGKHFCAGGDVSPGAHLITDGPSLPAVCDLLASFSKPVVAVVQGACLGGGLALAGSCDILIAQADAMFAIPEVRLGFPAAPLLPRFIKIFGARQLSRLGLTAERFDADEGRRLGLVHVRADAANLEAMTAKVVDDLLLGEPNAQASMKSLVARLGAGDATAAQNAELASIFQTLLDSPEGVEGRAAFREKRRPRWYIE
ncbi:enoyl-CoA hydratase-related protein [soil metagenome]